MNKVILLSSAILAEVIATLSLRAMEGWDRPYWLILVVAGYTVAFLLLSQLTKTHMAIGAIYAIWAASGIALTAIFGSILFSEHLTVPMVGGIAAIILGVVLVESGSKHDEENHVVNEGN
jgi:small multidrug resistance pump